MTPDLLHIDTWLFDVDHTLYPFETKVMHRVSERMTAFVIRELGLPYDEARALQKRYLAEHGTTLAGLMAHHGVAPRVFLDEVHDVPMDGLEPDEELNGLISGLPGQRIVFSNGDEKHVLRVLERLGMSSLFDGHFWLEHADYVPKPHPGTFARMMATHGVTPESAIFFEDSARNLKPARELGMVTVLVGPHAADNTDSFVDFRAPSLKAFLAQLS